MFVNPKEFTTAIKAALCFSDKTYDNKNGLYFMQDGDDLFILSCDGGTYCEVRIENRDKARIAPFGLEQKDAEVLTKLIGSRRGLISIEHDGKTFTSDVGYQCLLNPHDLCAPAFRKLYAASWRAVPFAVGEKGWNVVSPKLMANLAKALAFCGKDGAVRCRYVCGATDSHILSSSPACAWELTKCDIKLVSMFYFQQEEHDE